MKAEDLNAKCMCCTHTVSSDGTYIAKSEKGQITYLIFICGVCINSYHWRKESHRDYFFGPIGGSEEYVASLIRNYKKQ